MKNHNIVIGLILCILAISITLTLMVSAVSALPTKQFDAHEKKLTITDASGTELQIKSISIKEGVCKFEEIFEVTALNKDYIPSKDKDFKLSFKNKKHEDVKHKISTEEWFVLEDNEWKPVKWKKIKAGETKRYKVVLTKQAELGDKRILTVPSFMGVEDERLSWWNVSWQYRMMSFLTDVPSGGYQYNLMVHSASGTNNQTDVFLNEYNATNFSDIRFVLNDLTELNYWIEDNTTDPIKVWIKVPSNGTVYIYYGNPFSASSASNGTNTFEFFDDFEDGDISDWTDAGAGSYSIADGKLTLTNPKYIQSLSGYTGGYAVRSRQKVGTDTVGSTWGGFIKVFGGSNVGTCIAWYASSTLTYFNYNSGDGVGCDFGNFASIYETANYHIAEARRTGSADTFVFDSDPIKTGSHPHNSSWKLGFEAYSADLIIDWILVRKYTSPEPTWSTWSYEEEKKEPEGSLKYSTQRKLGRTSEGYLHRVYTKFDGSNHRVYYAKSTDEGSIWTETVLTDTGMNNTHPTIASDSEDNLWVVYEKEGSGIMYRRFEGLSWQTEQTISSDGGEVPVIAVDSDDSLHTVWMTNLSSVYQLRYWNGTNTTDITTGSEDNQYPSLAVDINNYLYVTYQKWNSTTNTYNIKHRKYTDSWQSVYNITSGETYNQTYPCIATDLSGNAHIIWQTQDHQIKSIKYKSDGSWEAIKTVYDGGVYKQGNPSISVYSDNYVYATWLSKTATYHENYVIQKSVKTTGSWGSTSVILHPSGKDVVYPNLVSALYPKICSDCYTNIPDVGYAFVYDEDGTVKYYKSADLAWRCPTKYVLTIKAINIKTGADVTSFSADIGIGETKTTTNGIIKFRCLDTGYYSLKLAATEYYTYIDNIVMDATKEITLPLTPITEADYYLPKAKTVTFRVQDLWGTTKFEGVCVEAVGYNISHPEGWLGDIFGFTNETEIYNTTQSGTTDSEGEIVFVMVETIKYKVTFVNESVGINKTWFKYPTSDKYTIVIWAWEYPEEGTEELLETTLNITTSTINDTHALIHVSYTDPSDLTNFVNINITRLTTFNREEVVWNFTETNQSIINESFVVTPYQGRSFNVKVIAQHEKWGEKIWEYGIKFKGLLSDLELPEKMYPIMAIALIFFIGGFFGATTALQGSLIISIVSWIFYGIGWLSLASDPVMISALSLATVMSILGLIMEKGRKTGVQ